MSDPHDEPTRVGIPAALPGEGGTPPPTGGPPPTGAGPREPDNTRMWVIGGLAVLAIVIALAAFVLSRDDGSDTATDTTEQTTTTASSSSTSSTTATTAATTTTAGTTATVTAPTSTTSGPTPVTADPVQCREAGSDAGDAETPAKAVFVAWTRTDRACADELMTDAALAELFGRNGADAQDIFQGCSESTEGDPHMECAFSYEGGATFYLMNFSPTVGWQVFDITQIAD